MVVDEPAQGLDPDELGLVFNRFWRADPARARTTGGSGLGLAISQKLVADLGGEIQVESTPGKGSCFRLILPRGKGAAD